MKGYSRVYAEVDLEAAVLNLRSMKKNLRPGTRMMAVVKTDGYGHGAVPIAKKIESEEYLEGFAVATAAEAMELRQAGIKKTILILGYTFEEDYEDLIREDIRPAVYKVSMAEQLSETAKRLGKNAKIHIKIDTGMSRIGFQANREEAKKIRQIYQMDHIEIEGIFTHFAKADETDKSFTRQQYESFCQMIHTLEEMQVNIPMHHCSNSAGIIELPEMNMDMVRAGITLYGLWPSSEVSKEIVPLRPLLTLKSQIVHIKELGEGRTVSYGGTYRVEGKKKIATIPVGYGDGYPRQLSNRGTVLIRGRRAPIVGRICMDQFMVDVTDIEGVRDQDVVTLIGRDGEEVITMEELGELSGRFNYEFACDLGKRIPRKYCHQ